MELDNYQNLNNFQPDRQREDRGKHEAVKPEHGVRSAEPVRGKQSSLVIYILLGLSILLSVVILGTAVILFTGSSEKTRSSLAELRTDISQLKEVPGMSEEIRSSLAELRTEISQLKEKTRSQCPNQWSLFNQKLYYFSTSKKTWNEAQESCKSMDANLVVINSAEEQEYLQQGKLDSLWIGLNDRVEEGKWRWVDGTDYASTVTFWASGQPNQNGDEDCAVASETHGWHDWPCSSRHSFICEKSP
uniref:CD209 antigen-like protein C n=1 Tax=Pristiophorus japonicus TaxID=55135 RepID=UPI00398E5DD2